MGTTRAWAAAIAGGLLLGAALPAAPASALKPWEVHRQDTAIICDTGIEGESLMEMEAVYHLSGELVGGRAVASTRGDIFFAEGIRGTYGGGVWDARIDFVTSTGAAAGSLVVSGGAGPVGPPLVVDERTRAGNAWSTTRGTVLPLVVDGAVTAASGDLADLLGTDLTCHGREQDIVLRGSDPATRIEHLDEVFALCGLGDHGLLFIDVFGGGGIGSVVLEPLDGSPPLVASGPLHVTSSTVTGELPVEGLPADAVRVDLQIGAEVESGKVRVKERDRAYFQRYTHHALTGVVVAPDGSEYGVDCALVTLRSMSRVSVKAGQ